MHNVSSCTDSKTYTREVSRACKKVHGSNGCISRFFQRTFKTCTRLEVKMPLQLLTSFVGSRFVDSPKQELKDIEVGSPSIRNCKSF